MNEEPFDNPQSTVGNQQAGHEVEASSAKAARVLQKPNRRAEGQLHAAREDDPKRLSDAERLAQQIVEEAKAVAAEEGAKIIAAAKAEAEADAEGIKLGMEFGGNRVQRLIEFPPELKQAGIGILSYFSEVLKQRYPDQEMAVRIEQFGTKVRLTVDSPSGWRDTIEHDLETYGRVVIGQVPASAMLSDQLAIVRLENKLQVAKVELDFEKRLNLLTQSQSDDRVRSLEFQVHRLYAVLDRSLSQHSNLDVLSEALLQLDANSTVREALQTLQLQLGRQPSDIDRSATAEALAAIKRDDPSILKRIYDLLSSTASGTAGNLLATWIESLSK